MQHINPSGRYTYIPLTDPSLVYTTYDFNLSASLLCAGHELLTLDRDNPRRAMFVFKRTTEVEKTANAFLSDGLQLPARKLLDTVKALKSQLYQEAVIR